MTNQFSRRTAITAIDVLDDAWYHADLTSFLLELGPAVYSRVRAEPTSLKHRMSDLKLLLDDAPAVVLDGEPLARIVVERAVAQLPPEPEHEWSRPKSLTPAAAAFVRSLEMDGFAVTAGLLRRMLPADIGLPETESELMRLLDVHGMTMPKGHLEQAIDAHARGNWAAANGQIRTFLDGLLDTIAERIDHAAQSLPTGHPRRTRLAASGFLSRPLNEWDDDGRGFINGLVKRLHPQGPHPGLSDEDDSTFRLHTVLLTATLLLRRFDRGPN